MLKRLLLGLLVLGSGVSLLAEARRAVASWDARAGRESLPDDWRLGSPPVARLAACLDAAHRLVPGGSAVAFATPAEPPEGALLAVRWAAYLMPADDVFGQDDVLGKGAARYVISWRLPLAGPRLAGLQPVRQLPGCSLYEASRP